MFQRSETCARQRTTRLFIEAALGALLIIGFVTDGIAFDDNVVANCAEDYFAFCSQHAPESTEVRYCMEAHRKELSKQCVGALVEAGEVPKKYLTKKIADGE